MQQKADGTDEPRNIRELRSVVGHVEDSLGSEKQEDNCEKILMIPEAQGPLGEGAVWIVRNPKQ